jgi:DNA-repair protein complementing XP-A cells
MKLFLRMQVEKRALEIWGKEETLEEEHEKREDRRDQAKVKKFNKKLKALRMQVH